MTIASFTQLYERAVKEREFLSDFVTGHLVLEYLLRKIVSMYDPALSRIANDLNHFRLITLNADIGSINEREREALVRINTIRSKLAHQITYEPTLEEFKEIFRLCECAFSDLTDGIVQGKQELDSAQAVRELGAWVIPELFVQISYDLHEKYQEYGGDIEDF
jgi:hypothetical protein